MESLFVAISYKFEYNIFYLCTSFIRTPIIFIMEAPFIDTKCNFPDIAIA